MMSKYSIIYFVFLFLIITGCRKQEKTVSEEEFRKTKEALVGANRILVKKDAEKIKAYIKRRNWEMQETASGLWYMITDEGHGNNITQGKQVTLNYSLELLDGTHCYSSDSLGMKQFRVGQGGVESGLEEGILLLKEGSKAHFIMPPHLAHGLPGDGNRIPARSVIIYEVEVVNMED
ncbi:MAG: FKBP-type peptidyl-prolyl cis-trans isomerase [Bacteroidales bacterium]|nr:FKBP-type peptidyl-prolyl cis-trans isomerase [Bacteroidales bacterium]